MSEEHRWSVRVTAAELGHCTAFARRRQVRVGAPLSFDAEYDETTALELFLSAVGADVVQGMFRQAKRRRLDVSNVEATVECTLDNPLTWLDVVGEEGHPGVRELRMTVYVDTLADDGDIDSLWSHVLKTSPMIQTLRRTVALDFHCKTAL